MGALLRELKPLLHLDCMTVTGETLGERLDGDADSLRRPLHHRRRATSRWSRPAAWWRCSATWRRRAPSSSARRPTPNCSSTRAGRWCSPRWPISRRGSTIRRSTSQPQDILVLQNAGPHAPECMPEAGYLPIPKKLAQRGVKDMVRISDARMSGTAFGTIVLHITPDAASGGPLGLVRNGDRIRLSVKERRIELLVDDAELKKRAAAMPPPAEAAAARLCQALRRANSRRRRRLRFQVSDAALAIALTCHAPRRRGSASVIAGRVKLPARDASRSYWMHPPLARCLTRREAR